MRGDEAICKVRRLLLHSVHRNDTVVLAAVFTRWIPAYETPDLFSRLSWNKFLSPEFVSQGLSQLTLQIIRVQAVYQRRAFFEEDRVFL